MAKTLFVILFLALSIQAPASSSSIYSGDAFEVVKYFEVRLPNDAIMFSAPAGLEFGNLIEYQSKPTIISYRSKHAAWYSFLIASKEYYAAIDTQKDPSDNFIEEIFKGTSYQKLHDETVNGGNSSGKKYLMASIKNGIFDHIKIIEGKDELYITLIKSSTMTPPDWWSFEVCPAKSCKNNGTTHLKIPIYVKKPFPDSDYFGCIEKEIDVSGLSPSEHKTFTVGVSEIFVHRRTNKQIKMLLEEHSPKGDDVLPFWWSRAMYPIDLDLNSTKTRSIDNEYFVFWRAGPIFGVYINYVPQDYSHHLKHYPNLKVLGSNWSGGFIDVKNFVAYDLSGRPVYRNPSLKSHNIKNHLSKSNLVVPTYDFDKASKKIKLKCDRIGNN